MVGCGVVVGCALWVIVGGSAGVVGGSAIVVGDCAVVVGGSASVDGGCAMVGWALWVAVAGGCVVAGIVAGVLMADSCVVEFEVVAATVRVEAVADVVCVGRRAVAIVNVVCAVGVVRVVVVAVGDEVAFVVFGVMGEGAVECGSVTVVIVIDLRGRGDCPLLTADVVVVLGPVAPTGSAATDEATAIDNGLRLLGATDAAVAVDVAVPLPPVVTSCHGSRARSATETATIATARAAKSGAAHRRLGGGLPGGSKVSSSWGGVSAATVAGPGSTK